MFMFYYFNCHIIVNWISRLYTKSLNTVEIVDNRILSGQMPFIFLNGYRELHAQ